MKGCLFFFGPHLHGSLGLDEPAPQHGLHLAVGQLAVSLLDLLLHRVLQQEPPQTPVKELPGRAPLQHVLPTRNKTFFWLRFISFLLP